MDFKDTVLVGEDEFLNCDARLLVLTGITENFKHASNCGLLSIGNLFKMPVETAMSD